MERLVVNSARIKRLLLLFFMLVFCAPAQAAEKVSVGEVVVTATRYEERTADIPSHITVISEDVIRSSTAHTIPDLLRSEAGVQVNDLNGTRRSFTVDLRGFGETAASNTLVLVDGRRINQADLSGVDWANIPIERVEKIEIIRGGRGAVLYGDNATGGVINIITKEGEKPKAEADLLAGSFGAFRTSASAGGRKDNLSLHLSGSYLTSDGFRDNSTIDSKDIGFNAAYYVKDYMKIQFSSGYHRDKAGLPGALKESDFAAGRSRTDTLFPHDFARTEDYYFKLAPEIYFAGDSSFKIDTSFRKRSFVSFSSGDWGNFLGNSDIATTAVSPQLVLKPGIGAMPNSLTVGIDYEKADNDIVNDSLFFGSRSIGNFTLNRESQGYYIHDELSVTNALRLSAGYRYDKARFTFEPSSPSSISMSQNVYTAGINYSIVKKSYLYASCSRSFRYPLLDELYSFITNTVNTSLVPQTSQGYEAGVRYYITDKVYVHANYFRLDTNSEIVFNPLSFVNQNLDGKTRRNGIEISGDAKATDWLTLRGSYTYMNAEIKGGTFSGGDVPNVPRQKATAEAVIMPAPGITAAVNGVYIGARPFISDFGNNFTNQKSYLVMNAKVAYQKKAIKAYVEINNLTNKDYAEFGVIGGFPAEKAFYPSPKRNFMVGLSMGF
jgi:iron complex outermembrane receptor protein